MDTRAFDGFARQIGPRLALQARGAAAVANTSEGMIADAKNGKKKNRNGKGRGKIFARCKSQGPACEAFIRQSCGVDAACLTSALPCCQQIEICEFTAFVTCFNAVVN